MKIHIFYIVYTCYRCKAMSEDIDTLEKLRRKVYIYMMLHQHPLYFKIYDILDSAIKKLKVRK